MRSSAGALSAAQRSDTGSGPNIEPLDMSMLGQDLDSLRGDEQFPLCVHTLCILASSLYIHNTFNAYNVD